MEHTLKSKYIYLLDSTTTSYRVDANYKDDVENALKIAKKAFSLRYEHIRLRDNSDFYRPSGRASSNLPTGDRGYLMFGHFLSGLLTQTVGGRTIKEILTTTPETDANVFTVDCSKACWLSFSGGEKVFQYPSTVTSGAASTLSGWCDLANAIFAKLIETFTTESYNDPVGKKNKIQLVKCAFDVFKCIKINTDDKMAFTYVLSVIKTYLEINDTILRVVSNDTYSSLAFTKFDIAAALHDVNKLVEIQFALHDSERYLENLKRRFEVYNIDLTQLKLVDGYIQVPENFYDKIIDVAINGVLDDSHEEFLYQDKKAAYLNDLIEVARISRELRYLKDPAALPQEFDACIPLRTYVLTGDIKSWANQVSLFKMTYPQFVEELVRTVNLISERKDGYWFPQVSCRHAPYEGIDTYYRFDFSSRFTPCYLMLKLAKRRDQYDVDVQGTMSFNPTGDVSHEDQVINASYLHYDAGNNFFGTVTIDQSELQLFKEQFMWLKRHECEDHHVEYILKQDVYKIIPPGDVVRARDIIDNNMNRLIGAGTKEYSIERVELKNATLLDLMFCFRQYEVSDPAKYPLQYESRFALLDKRLPPKPQSISQSVPKIGETTPNYGLLFSVAGGGDLVGNNRQIYLPRYMNYDISVVSQKAKGLFKQLPRRFSYSFPIEVRAINSRYLENKKAGDTIYASGDKRWGVNRVVVVNTPFNKHLPDTVTCTLTMDLYYDAAFTNIEKQFETRSNLNFIMKPQFSDFSGVSAEFGDTMAVIDENGSPVNWESLFSTRLSGFSVGETIFLCVKHAFLRFYFLDSKGKGSTIKEVQKGLAEIVKWMERYFASAADVYLAAIYQGFLGKKLDDLKAFAQIDNPTEDQVDEMFEALFGPDDRRKIEIPCRCKRSYSSILDDALWSIKRRDRNDPKVSVRPLYLPETVFYGTDMIQNIATAYLTRHLADIDWLNPTSRKDASIAEPEVK